MGLFSKKQEPQSYSMTDEERETINDVGYKIANADSREEQLAQMARAQALGGNDYKIVPCGPQGSGIVTHYEKRRR